MFVNMLIDKWADEEIASNNHLTPFWKICDFCHLDFNFIGFLETWNDDLRYISNKVWKVRSGQRLAVGNTATDKL